MNTKYIAGITFAAIVIASAATVAAEPLFLQWGTIETSGGTAQAESASLKTSVANKASKVRMLKTASPVRAAYIVQFESAVTEEWRTWLESATLVRGYLPENAYIVWATASEMETIASHAGVHWVGEWKNEYKTVLARAESTAASDARWMHVCSLMADAAGATNLQTRIEALGATVGAAFLRIDGSSVVACLTDAQIDEIAAWPDVEWIEPKPQARLFNDQAACVNMMNVTPAWQSISDGGLGLTGTNQIVAVADTGLDMGSTSNIHADFAGRILAGYGWKNGSYNRLFHYSWKDTEGHGTHVCGSVLGNGAMSGGQYRGMAYEAKLVMQGFQADLSGIPSNIQDLFKQAYSAGARIHSDSWGYGVENAGNYNSAAVYADDYMWKNQNFLAVFAAGNDGTDADKDGVVDPGSVTPPSTCKNGICVGASENYRNLSPTYGSSWPDDFSAAPISTDKIAQTKTPQGIVAFSARGPTADGRIKPDIVAPGSFIISTRSRASTETGWGTVYGNTNYLYMGGTSMATPLVSGTMALIRQWLIERKHISEPPAALMKALLINGARNMYPGQYGYGATQEITARPDRSQGFGHVNLHNSLEPGAGNFLTFVTNCFTSEGSSFTTNIVVGQANAGPYTLTLVWQDYPGTTSAAKTLVNDLDLTVTSPSGTVYYPNNIGGLDHTNNVEFIEFTASETGSYEVNVNAFKINKISSVGAQPYALVMRGPETVPEETDSGGVVVDVGGGKSVTVPGEWLAENTNTTINAATDVAANGRLKVWECYVLGLDPLNATNDFRITSFPMNPDGTPNLADIEFEPPPNRWNVPATYKLKGKASLQYGQWQDVNNLNVADPSLHFFTIEVILP